MSDVLKSNVEYNYGNSIEAMNQILSDAHVLWVKTHQAHWYMINSRNVMSDFLILHDWLDKPLDFLIDLIDDVAERIVMLNGKPVSTLKGFLDSTTLSVLVLITIPGAISVAHALQSLGFPSTSHIHRPQEP